MSCGCLDVARKRAVSEMRCATSPSLAVRNSSSPKGWSQKWAHELSRAVNYSEISASNALSSLPWAQGSPVEQSAAKLPLGPAVPATSTHRRRERWLPLGAALRAPQQYIRQAEQKTNVVLFGRLSTADRAFYFGPRSCDLRHARTRTRTPHRDHLASRSPVVRGTSSPSSQRRSRKGGRWA